MGDCSGRPSLHKSSQPRVAQSILTKPEADAVMASSAGLEEQDSDLTEVEVDEMLGLVGHVGTEVTAHNAVPRGVVLLVELLLDECGNILLNIELLEGLGGNVDSVLLHVLGHVCII